MGDIAFGGLIGLAVDFASGGAYQLSPESLSATLQPQGQPLPKPVGPPSGNSPAG